MTRKTIFDVNAETIALWAVAISFVAFAASNLGPFYDEPSDTVALLTMFGALVATPFSIVAAVWMHHRSIRIPQETAESQAADFVYATIGLIPYQASINLWQAYDYVRLADTHLPVGTIPSEATKLLDEIESVFSTAKHALETRSDAILKLPTGARSEVLDLIDTLRIDPKREWAETNNGFAVRAMIVEIITTALLKCAGKMGKFVDVNRHSFVLTPAFGRFLIARESFYESVSLDERQRELENEDMSAFVEFIDTHPHHTTPS